MKTLHILTIISLFLIPLGSILIIGGNHIGEYITISGALLGTYCMTKTEGS